MAATGDSNVDGPVALTETDEMEVVIVKVIMNSVDLQEISTSYYVAAENGYL